MLKSLAVLLDEFNRTPSAAPIVGVSLDAADGAIFIYGFPARQALAFTADEVVSFFWMCRLHSHDYDGAKEYHVYRLCYCGWHYLFLRYAVYDAERPQITFEEPVIRFDAESGTQLSAEQA